MYTNDISVTKTCGSVKYFV